MRNASGDLGGCLLFEVLHQNHPKKKKVPMPFAWLETFFSHTLSLPLTLPFIGGRF